MGGVIKRLLSVVLRSDAAACMVMLGFSLAAPWAGAGQIDTGNADISLRWDNTFKYSALFRVTDPNSVNLADVNADDGDRNFRNKGIASNRLDWLTEFDLKWSTYGFSASANGWYDTEYNKSNENNSPLTSNNLSVPYNRFTNKTRDIEGRYIELVNAFIYGSDSIGGRPVNWRIGRYTLNWGESLLFPDNGVAYGQSPVDAIKAISVPNTQAKELFLPTSQVSLQIPLNEKISVEAFNKFEWRASRLPAAGSYFSSFDAIGDGAERLTILPPGVPGLAFPGGGYAVRIPDQRGSGLGQFGVALKYHPSTDWDLGVYAERYNDTSPQIYTGPLNFGAPFTPAMFGGTPVMGSYQLVYPEHVQLYGLSVNTTVGDFNYGGEISERHNSPLVSSVTLFAPANNSSNPAYAVGDTLHGQLSTVYIGPASPVYQGITLLGEIAGVHVLDVYKNLENLDDSRTRSALGLRIVALPAYYQVLSGLDLTVPIGLGWNFLGRSPTETFFNGSGADHGGDLSVGVSGTLNSIWIGTLNYTHYLGTSKQTYDQNGPDFITNPLVDRDFISISIQGSF